MPAVRNTVRIVVCVRSDTSDLHNLGHIINTEQFLTTMSDTNVTKRLVRDKRRLLLLRNSGSKRWTSR